MRLPSGRAAKQSPLTHGGTENNWTLTDGTTWGTGGPGVSGSNVWDPISISDASGTVSGLEGWTLNLSLVNSNLTIDGLKKFQAGDGNNNYVSIDSNSTLTINRFGYAEGSDGQSVYLTNYGTFNLQLAKNQGGAGFIMDLGSTGVVNVTSSGTDSNAFKVKVASVSADLERDDAAKTATSGKTTLLRQLISLGENASFDTTATTFSATSGVDGK